MKINLVGINCKYIHTNLAIRSIKKYCEEQKINNQINLFEYTINNNIDDILEDIYINKPDLLGFSVYLWNVEIIKNLIKELKKVLPNTTVVVGGPEVSYYTQNEFVELGADFLVKSFGEKTFYDIVKMFECDLNVNTLKGVMYKCNGLVVENSELNFAHLNEIPFVYGDCLDDFENKIIYYEASRGCPYTCQYCLSSVEDGFYTLNIDRVFSDLKFFIDNNVMQVKFCDRTFNANRNFAKNVWKYIIKNDNNYTNFHFELSAEIIDPEMIEILTKAREGLIQFEIGVQSTNQETLGEVARSINTEKVFKNVRILNSLGNIHLHTDLIVGLPYENFESFKKSFNDVYSLKAEQLQVGFLKLLKGSKLRENAEKHEMLYKDYAPYEILSNKWLTFDEVLILKSVENMTEIYYNSGSFKSCIDYLVSLFETPFEFYLELALFYKKNNLHKFSHKKNKLYENLYNFSVNKNLNINIVKNYIKYDILSKENLPKLPEYLNSYSDLKWEYINNEQFVSNHLGDYLNSYDKKAIARNIRFEKFDFDMINSSNTTTLNYNETVLMFDYLNKISKTSNKVKISNVTNIDV